ncbi:MAG: hypothetical protein U0441_35845 [Polyangiaceae bacterium]
MTRLRRAPFGFLAALVASCAAVASAQTPPPTWNAPPPQGTAPGVAPTQAPPPPAFPPSLQAGGLTPPPSTTTTTPNNGAPNPTQGNLDKAQKEDSKRGLEWFWFNAEGGFSYVDMRTFSGTGKDFTAGFVPTQTMGATAGAAAGVKLLFFTIGARGRVGIFDPYQLVTVGGEIGMHFPLGRVEPHFELGGGYALAANIGGLSKGTSDAISIAGGYGRLSAGVDVFPLPFLSVGVLGSAEFLGLSRPALSATQVQSIKDDPNISDIRKSAAGDLATAGSGAGLAAGATAVIGLHF